MNLRPPVSAAAVLLAALTPAAPALATPDLGALTELSLEELMELEVTSVSRKSQSVMDSAAAVFVLTAEDIRRSSATTIPELLRMAPGVQVARIDAHRWAISMRGFNSRYANKLLVLVDGRSIYTPIFGGVYWEHLDMPLGDIERIEVIRGPGGSLWGANAVNGVINIITRDAADTQGGVATLGAGNTEPLIASLRWGGGVGEYGHYRIYGKRAERDAFEDLDGRPQIDDTEVTTGGLRFDWERGNHHLTAQAEFYDVGIGVRDTEVQLTPNPATGGYWRVLPGNTSIHEGYHLMLRWEHDLGERNDLALQFYHDHTDVDDPVSSDKVDTYDLDFQHRFLLGERQEIVWGLGYRSTESSMSQQLGASYNPSSYRDELYTAFIHDEIRLAERLRLTLGAKFEDHKSAGSNIQPNARLMWRPNERSALWAAVSRAVRVPSRYERDVRLNMYAYPSANPTGLTLMAMLGGGPGLTEEHLTAYELGYRVQPSDELSLDLALFHNEYDDLIVYTFDNALYAFEAQPAPAHYLYPLRYLNGLGGRIYGLELAANWQVTPDWRLTGSYGWTQGVFRKTDPIVYASRERNAEGNIPEQQLKLRSHFRLTPTVELDADLSYVDRLPHVAAPNVTVDHYTRLDLRLGWRPTDELELSLALKNLLDDKHYEWNQYAGDFGMVERSIFAKMTYRW